MKKRSRYLPRLSTVAGAALAGLGAYVATSHIADEGLRWLIWGIAAGSVIAVPRVRAAGKAAATLAVVAILAAELFGGVNQAERLLAERATRSADAEKANRERDIAVANETAARKKLTKAEEDETEARKDRGCGKVCLDMEKATVKARAELATAQEALKNAPAAVIGNHLAHATGIPEHVVELVPALLASAAANGLAFALLLFGHGGRHEEAEAKPEAQVLVAETIAAPSLPAPLTPAHASNRGEVVDWIREFEARNGRKPQIPELQSAFALPKTTAWRRIKTASS